MTRTADGTVHILRIQCPDRTGIIHAVTGALARRGCNIVQNDEFVDTQTGAFFMRTEFTGGREAGMLPRELCRKLPKGASIELIRPRRKRIVILASKEPHCLGDLLLRHSSGELEADILAVVSNHRELSRLARRFEVPYIAVPSQDMERDAHERALQRVLSRLRPEYLVLAKYMRILSAESVARYAGRIINIHHSFLPAFAGAQPYRQAAERGVKIIGATAHFVTEQLDQGPIISQAVVPVDHSHGACDMAQAGRDVEKIVLARALKLAFEDRIFVSGNRTVIFE